MRLRHRLTTVLAVAVMALALPIAALADHHLFTDGPFGAHEDGVHWLSDTGVTSGCTPTEYCPSQPVTRAQMATFMHRLSGNAPGIPPSVRALPQGDLEVTTGANAEVFSTGGAWQNVPGTATTVSVPDSGSATLLARFTAESACYGAAGYCRVRLLVDGAEAEPAVGADFAFDSSDNNTETSASWESHSVERVSTVGPGNHTVTVQVLTSAGLNLRLDDWTVVADGRYQ